ncbi:MAG: PEP-CTERM sorting domain-containing protein [Planctomycetota bacterium]
MKVLHTSLAVLAAMVMCCAANADTFTYSPNVDSVDSGVVDDSTFALPEVASINSISIDIAHTWGADLEITLTSPSGDTFVPMFDDVSAGGSGNFDMGVVAGDGSLGNVATYTFVESGGLTEYTDVFSGGGTYNANTWGVNGGEAAGNWNLLIFDDAGGDVTSIGSVTIDFSPIPEPATAGLVAGLFGLVALRRRK